VPPNSTAVGIPARVVVRSGQRVDVIDLHHEDLPDPVVEMFRCLTRRLERLERRVSEDEGVAEERDEAVFADPTGEVPVVAESESTMPHVSAPRGNAAPAATPALDERTAGSR
jgi:hypothetical protein